MADGLRRRATEQERMDPPPGARLFRGSDVTSQTAGATTIFPIELDGREFEPKKGGWKTNAPGMERLKAADRLHIIGNTLTYLRYLDDFSVFPRSEEHTSELQSLM